MEVLVTYLFSQVDEEILVERVVGRRLDPVTGKIYHLKYSPPENEEIAARLTQRFDDTEEKVCFKVNFLVFNLTFDLFYVELSLLIEISWLIVFCEGEVAIGDSSSERGSCSWSL